MKTIFKKLKKIDSSKCLSITEVREDAFCDSKSCSCNVLSAVKMEEKIWDAI